MKLKLHEILFLSKKTKGKRDSFCEEKKSFFDILFKNENLSLDTAGGVWYNILV